jgi:hypothetical protein
VNGNHQTRGGYPLQKKKKKSSKKGSGTAQELKVIENAEYYSRVTRIIMDCTDGQLERSIRPPKKI